MVVIRKLGDRVEKEHNQFLRDSQRLEDRSATAAEGVLGGPTFGGTVDFESLVGRANGPTVKADTVIDNPTSWDDDVWGSIFTANEESDSPISLQQIILRYLTAIGRSKPTSFSSHRTCVTRSVVTFLAETSSYRSVPHFRPSSLSIKCKAFPFTTNQLRPPIFSVGLSTSAIQHIWSPDCIASTTPKAEL
jgi:hypothetical protein